MEAGERLAIVAAEALHLKVSCEGSAAGSTPSSGAPSPRGPRLPEMEVIVMLTPRSQAELEDRSGRGPPDGMKPPPHPGGWAGGSPSSQQTGF